MRASDSTSDATLTSILYRALSRAKGGANASYPPRDETPCGSMLHVGVLAFGTAVKIVSNEAHIGIVIEVAHEFAGQIRGRMRYRRLIDADDALKDVGNDADVVSRHKNRRLRSKALEELVKLIHTRRVKIVRRLVENEKLRFRAERARD